MRFTRILASASAASAGAAVLLAGMVSSAFAQALPKEPKEAAKAWELGFQPAATPVAERLQEFHHLLLIIITLIVLFVLGLLIYVMVRFNERAHPVPSRTTHNTFIEVLWTVIPIMILVGIAIPSFKLLYYEVPPAHAPVTLHVTGHQWYWSYSYPENGKISFDSLIVPDSQLKPGQKRLLTVDNRVVVPVNTNVRVVVTSDDVIHSWAVPAFGVKMDAIPGHRNVTWFRVDKPGIYYGQCSELCGINHGFMPIAVEAVPKADFKKWVESKTKKAAADIPTPAKQVKLARAGVVPAAGN